MTSSLDIGSLLSAGTRMVIVAPHPDDESIATGGLIRMALDAGARVSVVVLTDGDMNPWPQRAAERRIMVRPADRERWGRRRREEVHCALARLGVGAADVKHAGFPDMGLTRVIARDPVAASEPLAAVFRDFGPSLVVAPSLRDTHPDHGAANVMTMLALAHSECTPTVLQYTVHGSDSAGVTLSLDPDKLRCKLDAVGEHRTQLVLSRARMRRYAMRPERFMIDPPPRWNSIDTAVALPWRLPSILLPFVTLLVVTRERAERLRPTSADGARSDHPRCVWRGDRSGKGTLELRIPSEFRSGGPLFARLESRMTSPWIYDHWGWTRLA